MIIDFVATKAIFTWRLSGIRFDFLQDHAGWLRAPKPPGTQRYNARMTIRTSEYMDAIDHLPEGATLVLQQFTWPDYQRLVHDLMDRHRLRVTYDGGRVEIMSTLSEHEEYSVLIDRLVFTFGEQFHLDVEPRGRTTWSREVLDRGLEADSCYYVTNASRIIGIRRLSLDSDPPPDIALEIDITNESLSKFPIYAAFKVPEIWRYDSRHMYFYELSGESYVKISESRVLPGLTTSMLVRAIERSMTEGQTAAVHAFRAELQLLRR
jgi:Uma2 family endonuclease